MEDKYYKKYLKYKLKYLELKQSGGGLKTIIFGIESKEWYKRIINNEILIELTKNIEEFTKEIEEFTQKSRQLTDTQKKEISDKHKEDILYIEDQLVKYLFIHLKREFKTNKEKNISINEIYKIFCNTINNYHKYFNPDPITTKINQLTKDTIKIINNANHEELIKHLDIIKTPLLKKTIDLYFKHLNNYIENDIIPSMLYHTCLGPREPREIYGDEALDLLTQLDNDIIINRNSQSLLKENIESMKNKLINILNKIIEKNIHDPYFNDLKTKIPVSKFNVIIQLINNNYSDNFINKSELKYNNQKTYNKYYNKYESNISHTLNFARLDFKLLKSTISNYLQIVYNYFI